MDDFDSYYAEIQSEILDEIQEYGENWRRSEDEGWFYPEEDGENS